MHNAITDEETLIPPSDDPDDSDETLSLSDLPLYSHQTLPLDQETSSPQEDHFEFFSQELHPSSAPPATAAAPPPENIIFCGKIIPFKKPPTPTCEIIKIQTSNRRNSHHWQLFRWKRREEGSRNGKVSVFTASSSRKDKWYLLMFGNSRLISPAVELRDIKSRQRSLRRHDGEVMDRDRGWWLWGLIRALSCGGNHHSTTVNAVDLDGYTSPE